MQGMQPMFGGIYAANVKKMDGSDPDSWHYNAVIHKLRLSKLMGRVNRLEVLPLKQHTLFFLDDGRGDHFTQLRKIDKRFPLAFVPGPVQVTQEEKRAREQATERDQQNWESAVTTLLRRNTPGEIRVRYTEKPIPPGSIHMLDSVDIREIDIRA